MKRFTKYLNRWRENDPTILEEEYKISEGCCLFHDGSELSNFMDIDDDTDGDSYLD